MGRWVSETILSGLRCLYMKKVDSLTFRGFEINGVQFITEEVVCPFCGGHAVIDHTEDFGDFLTLKIRCKDCGEEFEHDVDE